MSSLGETLASARQFRQEGDLRQAEELYRQILQMAPGIAIVHHELALLLQEQGRLEEAAAGYREALRQNSGYPQTYNNLGNILAEQSNLDAAIAQFHKALRLDPRYAEAHNNLGMALHKLGRLEEAVASYRRALLLKPDSDKTYNNLGTAYQELGDIDQALACYHKALECNPLLATTYLNLEVLWRKQGELEKAIAYAREAIRLEPQNAKGYFHLGAALQQLGQTDEAAAVYREALSLGSVWPEAQAAPSQVRLDSDSREQEASTPIQRTIRRRPVDRLRVAAATCLPVIYKSMSDLKNRRGRLEEQVRELRQEQVQIDLTTSPALSSFYVAYKGFNDRDIQHNIAQLYGLPRSEDPPPRSKAGKDKIHVGFVSSFFRMHTIGRLMGGLIKELARDNFSVTVVSVGRNDDEVAGFFKRHADRYLEVPLHLPAARRLIAEQHLDVLFYTDVGMDPTTSTLAFSRLAPVQCATWGHPVTTGIDAIDYFISSRALETNQAEHHYTETLVQLNSLPICYYRPEPVRPPRDREEFGLPREAHVYACPQSLFKIHPQFDQVLGNILRGDPDAILLMGWPQYPRWEQLLRERFKSSMPDVLNRVRFLPKLSRPDFLKMMALVDVLLDPMHFGGGNTSFEALSFGVPIVTLPSQFLRGRITYALYDQMQVFDCVTHNSTEYVERALKLGREADYREAVRRKILAASEVLYENTQGIRELEGFLRGVT